MTDRSATGQPPVQITGTCCCGTCEDCLATWAGPSIRMSYVMARAKVRDMAAKGIEAHVECVHTIDNFWHCVVKGPDPYSGDRK
jgi:hypothetical protein